MADYLLTSQHVFLRQYPWLHFLQVAIASAREIHCRAESILNLEGIHLFEVGTKNLVKIFQEFGIISMITTCRHLSLKSLESKRNHTIGEVAQISEQLIVVLRNEIIPQEDCILLLWPIDEQIVPPNFNRDACRHGVISENARAIAFREF